MIDVSRLAFRRGILSIGKKVVDDAISEGKVRAFYEPNIEYPCAMTYGERLIFEKGQANGNYQATELARICCEKLIEILYCRDIEEYEEQAEGKEDGEI